MAVKSNKRTFSAQLRIVAIIEAEILADTMEEAIIIGKAVKVDEILEVNDGASICDSSIRLTSIFDPSAFDVEQEK